MPAFDANDLEQQDWRERCVEAAYKWQQAQSQPNWVLVHCRVNGPNGPMLHAFCYQDDRVVDLTLKPLIWWSKDDYYQKFGPYDIIEYDSHQALLKNLKTCSYGFWDFEDIQRWVWSKHHVPVRIIRMTETTALIEILADTTGHKVRQEVVVDRNELAED